MALKAKKRAKKTPTNLSIREDLVRQARALQINMSELLESALEGALRKAAREKWKADNREAIAEYNDFVRREGLFSDGLRRF